jgi:hypothetical protein
MVICKTVNVLSSLLGHQRHVGYVVNILEFWGSSAGREEEENGSGWGRQ